MAMKRPSKRRFVFCYLFDFWILQPLRRKFGASTREFIEPERLPDGLPLEQAHVLRPRNNVTQISFAISSTSLFLTRLPMEIRQQIFHYVLGNKTLHLVRIPGKIVCSRKRRKTWVHEFPQPRYFQTDFDIITLSLLRTCRQIYLETVDIVYNSNVFNMEDPAVLVYLHDYYWPAQRTATIRHLEIQWQWEQEQFFEPHWHHFWYLVAFNMSLKSLSVCCEPRGPLSIHANWVRPMLGIRRIKQVHLELQVLTAWKPKNRDLAISLENRIIDSMKQTTNEPSLVPRPLEIDPETPVLRY